LTCACEPRPSRILYRIKLKIDLIKLRRPIKLTGDLIDIVKIRVKSNLTFKKLIFFYILSCYLNYVSF
jgi:hypothetical protein